MAEFRRDWLSDIRSMQQEMERLLGHFGSSKPPAVHFAPRVWEPAVDVYETKNEVVVTVELAGVRQEEIEVMVEGSTLVVRGARKETATQSRRSYHRMEIHRGFFERDILLPKPVDPEQTKAFYEDGLLKIVLPKAQREQTLQIKFENII